MTEAEKKMTATLEDVQEAGRIARNEPVGNSGTCTTAGGTAAKEVTLGTTFELVAGAMVEVTFQNAVTVAGATLAITHTTLAGVTSTEAAKTIRYRGAALAANVVKAGDKVLLRYDGTYFNVVGVLDQSKSDLGLGNVDNTSDADKKTSFKGSIAAGNTGFATGGDVHEALSGKVSTSSVGAAGGVASLDNNGKVPSSQLPGFVDDVTDLQSITTAPETCLAGQKYYNDTTKKIYTATADNTWGTAGEDPEGDKIYILVTDKTEYRWSGTEMGQLSKSLVIGTAPGTAADGQIVDVHVKNDSAHVSTSDRNKWNAKQDALEFNSPYNASTNKAATMDDLPTKEDFHEAVATLQSAPTSSTLTYTRDGVTYNYKIGDEVRVADSENGTDETNNYVFYKLYDLVTSGNTTTAYWSLAGAGGGSGSVMGKIRVNLRAYVNDVLSQGTDLNGAEVTLTNTTNSEVVGTQTWAGTTLIFNDVTPMKAYSISVSAKTGYTQPAAQTIAELPFSADETLSFDYEADEYTASIQSNQGTDSGISSAQITIAGTALSDGGTVKVAKGATITPTATDITGYRKTVSASGKIVTALYETEILSLTVSADDSSDVSAQQVTVTNTSDSSVLGTLVSGQTLKIAYGTAYKLAAAALSGYTTPTEVTATAGQTSRSVAMEYVYNPIEYAYVTFNQTQSGDTAVIDVKNTQDGPALTCPTTSGATHPNAAIQAIRDASHLYMGKQTAAGKQLLCQLSDSNGGQYTDGSTAKFDGSEGDHWMRIGVEVYIKRVSGADSGNTVVYGIAVGGQPDSTWKQIISPSDLLAVHEAYIESSKLYSRSGVQSGANQTRDTFKTYARNRNASGTPTGKGYSCVTWEWHCMMALLFYAWYGRTNCQAQCGTGASSYTRTLGAKNSLGMTDTTASNGNADDVKFWGIENWWGDKYEWVDNVDVNDRVWTVKDLAGNSVRTSMTAGSSDGWINKLLLSENLDLIPTGVGGAETTYYCDYYYQNTGSRVVARSLVSARSDGGVAVVSAINGTSYTYAHIGSRLAFKGEIEIAESVAAFKAASSVG